MGAIFLLRACERCIDYIVKKLIRFKCNKCKATAVTCTKRVDRNLLRKERFKCVTYFNLDSI